MASVQLLNNARSYFAQFDYPITKAEAIFWQSPLSPSRHPARKARAERLELREGSSTNRKQRLVFSKPKWQIAKHVGRSLSRIPTIQAIFVTGALSMDNCPEDDDIDLMIVTSPHTLWLTRVIVVLYLTLKGLRRPPSLPEHSSPRVKDKICDNLYLDTKHLTLDIKNLYLAHEILQAKCIFDRGGIHHQFLSQNPWVKKYLPMAYTQTLKQAKSNVRYLIHDTKYIIQILNTLVYFVQYLYMRPKLTRERVGEGFAFFHPRENV